MTDITARSVGIMGVQMVILCMACDSPFSLSMLEVFDVHRDNTVDVPNLCPSCGGYTPIDAGAEIVYGLGRFPSDSANSPSGGSRKDRPRPRSHTSSTASHGPSPP
jgi:hypothetical protein